MGIQKKDYGDIEEKRHWKAMCFICSLTFHVGFGLVSRWFPSTAPDLVEATQWIFGVLAFSFLLVGIRNIFKSLRNLYRINQCIGYLKGNITGKNFILGLEQWVS